MSELPSRTHNNPPITAPTDEAMLQDLQSRYPELPQQLTDFEEALKTFPDKLTLADEDVAAALQDLLGKMKKTQSVWKAHRGSEKKPWDTLVKVVMNYFGKAEDKVDGWLEVWKPRHQAFLDLKAAENRRLAEVEAERQREAEEASRKAAAEAEARVAAAREEEAAARRREEEARLRAEEEERKAKEAREAAERAAAEEKRIAEEKRQRDRAEKERNADNIKTIRAHMKSAEKLHLLAEAEEATEEEIKALDATIKHGGAVSLLAAPVANSTLLDEDQQYEIGVIKARLEELREAVNSRFSKREQAKRARERKEAEDREAAAAEQRRKDREADEARSAAARAERERLEQEAAEARERQRVAQGDVREARTDAREALSSQKGASKEAKLASTEADRAANRADRLDRRLENSTDADLSRTRGDLGTTGSLTGRWTREIVDEAALRAACGPLGEHFTEEALKGATYQWMAAHRSGFIGERVDDALPGVVFFWERDTMIRA